MEILVLVICVLVNVAFITLFERKILGYSQLRLGPNKPSWWGILQPMADAVKLFVKRLNFPSRGHGTMYYFSPMLALFLALFVWRLNRVINPSLGLKFSFLLIIVVLRFNVYPVLIRGWASNSKYSILGGLRGVAQTISYEIRLALILLSAMVYLMSLKLEWWQGWGRLGLVFLWPRLFGVWFLSRLAETNRTPFDFAEGESELVSGFNIEYGGGGFALIFMAEYASIYFLSGLTVLIFFPSCNIILYRLLVVGLVGSWIWIRRTFPRYRYDLLINLAWKRILPYALSLLLFRTIALLI